MTLVLALCILFECGCTAPVTTEPTALPTETVIQPVSFDDALVQYSDVNGITLTYREFGTENTEPLLMIIGFSSTMEHWNTTFVGILAENYHTYIYDQRDMGESSESDTQFTIPQLADDAAGLITALGYESMNTYSVSMGSSVAQELLIAHPENVRKAILSSASYSASIPETEKLHGILEQAAENTDVPEGVRKEAVANLEWEGAYDGLSGITNYVMLITGTEDNLTPQSVAVDIADQNDGSWLIRYKGIPHAGSSYAPAEYGTIVTTFLKMDESPA